MNAIRQRVLAVLTALALAASALVLGTAPPAQARTRWWGGAGTERPMWHGSRFTWRSARQSAAEEVVVKIDTSHGASIGSLQARYPIAVTSAVLASRGIYLVRSTRCGCAADHHRADQLAAELAADPDVVYAEPDSTVDLADSGFSEWSYSNRSAASAAGYATQPAVAQLRLDEAHAISTGRGITVAVLDTGADPDQPALAGHLVTGWNYVEDDADTDDVADAAGDQAVGHGTFIAGLVALAAPDARIMPERVLDGDGNGNVFVVAQAVLDAVANGANVINMSFGTDQQLRSHVLLDAIDQATAAGVLVVAAAGNDGNSAPHYPAALPHVLSVTASDQRARGLTRFSDYGSWTDVAAPGEDVIGPVPGTGYAVWSGTSMAAPFVAGEAALLFAAPSRPDEAAVLAAIERADLPLRSAAIAFGEVNPAAALRELD